MHDVHCKSYVVRVSIVRKAKGINNSSIYLSRASYLQAFFSGEQLTCNRFSPASNLLASVFLLRATYLQAFFSREQLTCKRFSPASNLLASDFLPRATYLRSSYTSVFLSRACYSHKHLTQASCLPTRVLLSYTSAIPSHLCMIITLTS